MNSVLPTSQVEKEAYMNNVNLVSILANIAKAKAYIFKETKGLLNTSTDLDCAIEELMQAEDAVGAMLIESYKSAPKNEDKPAPTSTIKSEPALEGDYEECPCNWCNGIVEEYKDCSSRKYEPYNEACLEDSRSCDCCCDECDGECNCDDDDCYENCTNDCDDCDCLKCKTIKPDDSIDGTEDDKTLESKIVEELKASKEWGICSLTAYAIAMAIVEDLEATKLALKKLVANKVIKETKAGNEIYELI